MPDEAKVAWWGTEVLTTADAARARVAWGGAEVLASADRDEARTGWFGVEVLTLRPVDRAQVGWLGVEVLTGTPFEPDHDIVLEPNVVTRVRLGAGLWSRITCPTAWMVAWSANHAWSLADSAGGSGRPVPPDRPLVVPATPGGRDWMATTSVDTVAWLEARAIPGIGRVGALRARHGRTPLG